MRDGHRDDQTNKKTDVLLNRHTTDRSNKPSRPQFLLQTAETHFALSLTFVYITSQRISHFLIHYQEITSRISDYFANQRLLAGLEKKNSNKVSSKLSQREVKITTKLQY